MSSIKPTAVHRVTAGTVDLLVVVSEQYEQGYTVVDLKAHNEAKQKGAGSK